MIIYYRDKKMPQPEDNFRWRPGHSCNNPPVTSAVTEPLFNVPSVFLLMSF